MRIGSTAPSPAVEKLWMDREYLVGNLLTQIFLLRDQPMIVAGRSCGQRLRASLRLIVRDDRVKSPTLLTVWRVSGPSRAFPYQRSGPQTSDRSSFRRKYRRASVPHRSDARQ